MLVRYPENLKPEINSKYANDYKAYADYLYKKSNFTSKEKVEKFLSLSETKMKKKLAKRSGLFPF